MADPLTWVAVGLLVAGVVGSLLPVVPGAALSLGGVYLHWWATGYAVPGPVALAALTGVGVLALTVDYLAGALSARAVGTPWTTSAIAAVAGAVLLVLAGPVGLLVGVAGVVFLDQYRRGSDAERSARAAVYAAIGVLASTAVQATLTLSMLVAMVVLTLG